VAVVVVVIVVGAVIAGAFYAGIQQAANLPPNVAVTNTHSDYYENCGAFGTQTTRWDWSATLVNTGGSGFADIGYDVNGQQVTQNTYYVAASYQTPITQSLTVSACYGSTIPTYNIVLLAERFA
jgi:hypothetical protein